MGYALSGGMKSNNLPLGVRMLLTKHHPQNFMRRGFIIAAIFGWHLLMKVAGHQL
jgi:hypothetical protein